MRSGDGDALRRGPRENASEVTDDLSTAGADDSKDSPNERRCLGHDIGDPQVGVCKGGSDNASHGGRERQRVSRWVGMLAPMTLRGKPRDELNRLTAGLSPQIDCKDQGPRRDE